MYDLYLSAGCYKPVELNTFDFILSPEVVSNLRVLIAKDRPEFLFLNLNREVARELMSHIKLSGGRGLVVEAKYREPMMDLERAAKIAENYLLYKQQSHPNIHFEAVKLVRGQSHPMWWTFGCVGQEWVKAGVTPGMLFASVDKVDGQLWSQEDMRSFHESQE